MCVNISFAKNLKLERRQYKNDTIWSKNKLSLNFPLFFTHRIGGSKSAAISNLIWSSTKWSRSYIVLAPKHSSLEKWRTTEGIVKWYWQYILWHHQKTTLKDVLFSWLKMAVHISPLYSKASCWLKNWPISKNFSLDDH